MSKKERIGDLLVAAGLVARSTAETAAVETVLQDTRVASILCDSGKAELERVLEILSVQVGVPAIDLSRAVIRQPTITKIPGEVARRHLILPVGIVDSTLLVAMADPGDQVLIDEVAFATGLQIHPHVALHSALRDAIPKVYADPSRGFVGARAKPGAAGDDGFIPVINPTPHAGDAEPELEEIEAELVDEPLDLETEKVATQPKAKSRKKSTASKKESGPARLILVVDDEPDIVQLVCDALKPLGHEVITALQGVEALKLIKSRRPDLIILDAMLPEIHGFEICRKVKESKRFGETPVLMISAIYRGWRIAADIESLYGVDVFLEKPFRVAELRRHAEQLLACKTSRNEDENLGRDASVHYETATAAYKSKDYDRALEELRNAETLEPFSSKIQFMMGRVLEQRQNAFRAIYHYERAIELDPSLFPATKNLALLYQNKGFRNKAIEMWERSLRAAPNDELREQIKKHLVSIL